MLQNRFLALVAVLVLTVLIQPSHEQGLVQENYPKIIRTEPIVVSSCLECLKKNARLSGEGFIHSDNEEYGQQGEQGVRNVCFETCGGNPYEPSSLPPNVAGPVAHMISRIVGDINNGVITLKPMEEHQDYSNYDNNLQTTPTTVLPESENTDCSEGASFPEEPSSYLTPDVAPGEEYPSRYENQYSEQTRSSPSLTAEPVLSEKQLTVGVCKCPTKTLNNSFVVEQDSLYAIRQNMNLKTPPCSPANVSPQESQCPALPGFQQSPQQQNCDVQSCYVKNNAIFKQPLFDNDNEFDFSDTFPKCCSESYDSNNYKRRKGVIY